MKLSLQIAAGIVIAAAIIWGATELRARYELHQLTAELATAERAAKAKAAELQRERRAHAIAENHRKADELQRRANAAESQLQASQAAAQKQQAFIASYKPPKDCENPIDWTKQVECGNHYMKARRAFMAD